MTGDEVDKYLIPALSNLFTEDSSKVGFTLDDLLGLDVYNNYVVSNKSEEIPLTDEQKELFIKLAGPYGQVVLKAYRIQKGLEND